MTTYLSITPYHYEAQSTENPLVGFCVTIKKENADNPDFELICLYGKTQQIPPSIPIFTENELSSSTSFMLERAKRAKKEFILIFSDDDSFKHSLVFNHCKPLNEKKSLAVVYQLSFPHKNQITFNLSLNDISNLLLDTFEIYIDYGNISGLGPGAFDSFKTGLEKQLLRLEASMTPSQSPASSSSQTSPTTKANEHKANTTLIRKRANDDEEQQQQPDSEHQPDCQPPLKRRSTLSS